MVVPKHGRLPNAASYVEDGLGFHCEPEWADFFELEGGLAEALGSSSPSATISGFSSMALCEVLLLRLPRLSVQLCRVAWKEGRHRTENQATSSKRHLLLMPVCPVSTLRKKKLAVKPGSKQFHLWPKKECQPPVCNVFKQQSHWTAAIHDLL